MTSKDSSSAIADKASLVAAMPLKQALDNQDRFKEYTQNLELIVKRQRKMLKETERLAAIGQTAGMVGHDIRNPLQAIVSELFLAQDEIKNLPLSKEKNCLLESFIFIEEQLHYINKIVSDLQDYARPLNPEFLKLDLLEAISDSIVTISVPSNIHLTIVAENHFPKLNLDPSFLKRILVNLVTNSIQAMPDGGKLTIRTAVESGKAIITVEDTGVGIPSEIRSKIFQPLMTSKSKGQGFGLAVVKRLVEAQNGTVTFESEKDVGTRFIITFLTSVTKNACLLNYF